MSRPVPARDYLAHFDPELAHHRAWLLAVMERLVAHEPLVLLKKSDGSGLLELKTAMEFLTRLRQKVYNQKIQLTFMQTETRLKT